LVALGCGVANLAALAIALLDRCPLWVDTVDKLAAGSDFDVGLLAAAAIHVPPQVPVREAGFRLMVHQLHHGG